MGQPTLLRHQHKSWTPLTGSMVNDFDIDIIINTCDIIYIWYDIAYDIRNDIMTRTLFCRDLIRIMIDVWMVKDHLYQISQFCCVDIVITNLNVILQNVFAQ